VVRFTALLCAAGAAALVAFAVPQSTATATVIADQPAHTPLLSPRRVPVLFADAAARARLQRDLAAVVAPYDACVAVDDDTGPLARVHADTSLAPASNLKLLTAAAALKTLGPAFRFRTSAAVDTHGNLVIVGGGDPLLATRPRPFAPVTQLDDLAAAIAKSGVRSINGSIVVDDARYDNTRFVADWQPSYVTDGDIGPIGALTVDAGFNDEARRDPAPDPALLAGARLRDLLRLRGIVTTGRVMHGVAAANAREVAHLDSPPLDAIVADMLATSNNYTAEMLTRELGRARARVGSTAAGTAAIASVMSSLGVPTKDMALHDGSGLAPDDRVTCSTLLAALELRTRAPFSAIDKGLPVAGRSGTLIARFRNDPLEGKLRAKTGSLAGVVALSGTIDRGSHTRFAFIADGAFSTPAGQVLQDEVAHAVARYPDRAASKALVPSP